MTKKTTRTRAEAKRLMWEYYRANKEWLPDWIREYREEILKLLSDGGEVSVIFHVVSGIVEYDTVSNFG
jgi:hypothetical protein